MWDFSSSPHGINMDKSGLEVNKPIGLVGEAED
jgi:hypothetical protein